MDMHAEINNFFANFMAVLNEAFVVISNLFLDYFFLIVAIGCWFRFCSQLFARGNFSGLLLLFAILTTAAAITMGQFFWENPIF